MRFTRRPVVEPTARYLTPGVQTQLTQIVFRQNDWLAPTAIWVCALLLLGSANGKMDPVALSAWFGVATLISAGLLIANHIPSLHLRVDRAGTPLMANLFGLSGGLCFASFLWIDRGAFDDAELHYTVFCILLAISAGSVGGLAGLAGHGRYMLYPIWISGSLELFLRGEFLLGSATVFFVLLLARDFSTTNSLLAEILFHREQADGRADAAQDEALRDPLTNLLNRAGLAKATELESFGSQVPVTAMFVDLDHFKMVNDRFGHAMGDQVLAEVANRLTSAVRPDDIVARLGGDEFLILIDTPLDRTAREGIARSIISALELPFTTEKFEARISASVGITVVPPGAFDLDAVQREADHALYVAKGQGRRRSAFFDEAARNDFDERSELEGALRDAIDTDGIVCWGQPIVDLDTEQTAVVELLARWPRRRYVLPA
ncbi:MAG: diguanylate cyclase [Acidimicrobiales bacterium]